MDATLATGAAAMMAIRVLLDHSVEEHNIILISLLMAEQGSLPFFPKTKLYSYYYFLNTGVHNVAYAFPKVRIVTTAVDPELSDNCYILPGTGNFGDRFFGTEIE
jgi:uridine kinase